MTYTLTGTLAFAGFLLAVIRPLLRRLLGPRERRVSPPAVLALALTGSAVSACVTDALGMHVTGAFLFGLAFPREAAKRARLHGHAAPLLVAVFLPVFFVLPGLGVNLRSSGHGGITGRAPSGRNATPQTLC